jgi:hypothetical protein
MPINEYDDAPIPYALTEKSLAVAVPSNKARLIELNDQGFPGIFVSVKEATDGLAKLMETTSRHQIR